MTKLTCAWCADIDTDEPDTLCRPHLAEWEGMSEAALDRMEAEQSAEYLDHLG